MDAAQLAAEVRSGFAATGMPYGFERSCKLVPGEILEERFLISIHKDAFLQRSLDLQISAAARQQVPEQAWQWLEQGWQQAEVVHFGYEASAAPVFKLYLEDCNSFMEGLQQAPQNRLTVFRALKWGADVAPLSSEYLCQPEQSARQLQDKIRQSFAGADPRAEALAQQFLHRALERATAKQLLLLEVEEPGSERSSFDLNLYDLESRVADWKDLIADVWAYQQLDNERLDAFLAASGDQLLGHISAGVGRNKQVFFTLYFGVSECHPQQ